MSFVARISSVFGGAIAVARVAVVTTGALLVVGLVGDAMSIVCLV